MRSYSIKIISSDSLKNVISVQKYVPHSMWIKTGWKITHRISINFSSFYKLVSSSASLLFHMRWNHLCGHSMECLIHFSRTRIWITATKRKSRTQTGSLRALIKISSQKQILTKINGLIPLILSIDEYCFIVLINSPSEIVEIGVLPLYACSLYVCEDHKTSSTIIYKGGWE